MSDVTVYPSKLSGRLTPPASKSHAHRLMIISAVSGHPLTILGDLNGDDIAATARCLSAIGTCVETGRGYIKITPNAFHDGDMDAGESGSTLRMLLPVIPTLGITARIDGRGRLPERPIGDIIEALRNAGAYVSDDKLPLKIGGEYAARRFVVFEPKSSQHISGMLIALAKIGGGRIDIFGELPSKGYVDMTVEALSEYGVTITADSEGYTVESGFTKFPDRILCEGDWSGAAALAAAAAVSGDVTIDGLKYPSAQPDSVIVKLLSDIGAKTEVSKYGCMCSLRVQAADSIGLGFNADGAPDIVPVLAAVLAFSKGESSIYGVERLKIKESDRIASVVNALNATGAVADYDGKRIRIFGGKGKIRGGTVNANGDHRIAMMGAVLATGAEAPVTISGADCVKKSYPGFFERLAELGGKIEWKK